MTPQQANELQLLRNIPFIYAYLAQPTVSVRGTENPVILYPTGGKVTFEWYQAHKPELGRPRDAYVMNDVLAKYFQQFPGQEVALLFGAVHEFDLSLDGPNALKARMYHVDASALTADELLHTKLSFSPSMSVFYESSDED